MDEKTGWVEVHIPAKGTHSYSISKDVMQVTSLEIYDPSAGIQIVQIVERSVECIENRFIPVASLRKSDEGYPDLVAAFRHSFHTPVEIVFGNPLEEDVVVAVRVLGYPASSGVVAHMPVVTFSGGVAPKTQEQEQAKDERPEERGAMSIAAIAVEIERRMREARRLVGLATDAPPFPLAAARAAIAHVELAMQTALVQAYDAVAAASKAHAASIEKRKDVIR